MPTQLDHDAGLFPALLRYWRGRRGLSQLDLALAADVSSRHVSFLETGRSSPSPHMVVRLATTLGVPLRQVDAMLSAAGHEPLHQHGAGVLPAVVARALDFLKQHQDPYPLLVVDRTYDVVDLNAGARALLASITGASGRPGADQHGVDPDDSARPNLARMTFAPGGVHDAIANFDEVGPALLWRIQREVLQDPEYGPLRDVLDEVLALDAVSPSWRDVDLSVPSDPVLVVHLRSDDVDLRFLTTVTAFQAPQNVVVDELRIETWIPIDEATAAAMAAITAQAGRVDQASPGSGVS